VVTRSPKDENVIHRFSSTQESKITKVVDRVKRKIMKIKRFIKWFSMKETYLNN